MVKVLFIWILTATALLGLSATNVYATTEDTSEIRAMTDHLNYWYPSLSLTTPNHPQNLDQVLNDLQVLEDALSGDLSVLPGDAKSLTCSHPSCGDNSRTGGAPK